ncbi:polyprenyl synthetase family protein [Pseudactinotalea suaedae]|uniref:polyprenyl synthetase family protein n=1 Tax=Pseudactinotalea suaedae TaxID=1524924 RepID=UPI001F4F70E4|nr:polyprenyl synthetase family protein [Pseudactinotalea suaedae]
MQEAAAVLRPAVTAEVLGSWRRLAGSFASVGPEVAVFFDVGADLLAHGKRLRASFASAGWRSLGGEALAAAEVRLGSGLELFQVAALVHDDLMDGSLTRRGRPSAHRQFAAHHDEVGLVGGATRFGEAGAILLGDLLLVAAQSELDDALGLVDANAGARGRRLVEEMMGEVTVGQFLDSYAQSAPWSTNPATDLDRARRVIRSKSARYSVEHPLVIGAALAGADDAMLAHLRAVGLPIGEAFQLRDDVLGVFGDPATTGKPAGDDLREGKRTVLVTLAMTLASERDVATLRTLVGRSDLGPDDIARVRAILTDSGALAAVEELIEERYQAGLAALAATGLGEEQRDYIAALAGAAIKRDA